MGFPESLSNKVLCKAQACRQHDGSERWLMRSQAFLCEGEFSCCIGISLHIFLVVLMAIFINFAIPKAALTFLHLMKCVCLYLDSDILYYVLAGFAEE